MVWILELGGMLDGVDKRAVIVEGGKTAGMSGAILERGEII
jgi:hypothetical protein